MKKHKKISKLKKTLILWDFLQKYNSDTLLVNTRKFITANIFKIKIYDTLRIISKKITINYFFILIYIS